MNARKCVTVRQIELLINFMESNNDLAHGRVRSKEGRAIAGKLWRQCAKILNAEDTANARTPKDWSKFYNDYKCRMKKKVRITKQSQASGPPSDIKSLTPLEERLYAIIEEDKCADSPICNNPIKTELEYTASPSEPTEMLCMDQSLPGPSSKYLNIDNQIEANIVGQEDANNNRERNKKIKRKGRHKESKIEKAKNEIVELEKEKLLLKRQLLAINREKATALTSLASAAWTLVNDFKDQSPGNKNTSTKC